MDENVNKEIIVKTKTSKVVISSFIMLIIIVIGLS